MKDRDKAGGWDFSFSGLLPNERFHQAEAGAGNSMQVLHVSGSDPSLEPSPAAPKGAL